VWCVINEAVVTPLPQVCPVGISLLGISISGQTTALSKANKQTKKPKQTNNKKNQVTKSLQVPTYRVVPFIQITSTLTFYTLMHTSRTVC